MADTPRVTVPEEKVYIDCEFDGHGGPLLSMALVRDDGRSIYLCVPDEPAPLTSWVKENVWPLVHMSLPVGRTVAFVNEWGPIVRSFLGNEAPIIIADSPVDIGRFCAVLSTGSDGGWASTDYPKVTCEVHNVDCYPTGLPGAVQHNAWWDAMALREALRPLLSAAPAPEGVADFYMVKAAIERAMMDERDGRPCGCIVEAGCESRGYADPAYAASGFIWAATDAVMRALATREEAPADCGNGHAPGCDCHVAEEDVARSKPPIRAQPPAREDAQPVHCHHEAYQGYCAHCGVKIVNGFAITPKPHPVPDALRAKGEELVIALKRYGFPVSGAAKVNLGAFGSSEAMAVDFTTREFTKALAALQAEQKGGA